MKTIMILISFLVFCSLMNGQNPELLEVSKDKRYLVTRDNQPFMWLGGTAWELIHRLDRQEVDYYLTHRMNKGFTVIQTVILAELDGLNTPNAYGHTPLISNDPTRINEEYFEHVDYVLQKAEELGMYIGLLPTWGDKFNKVWGTGPEIFSPHNAKIFGEILGRRYADQNNVIWILGGDRWPEDEEDREIINAMAEGIRNYDQIHLITYHPSGGHKATDFFNEPWLDLDMFQTGHDRTTRDYAFVGESRKVTPPRPVINGEPRYENHPDRFKPEIYGWMDDSDVRTAAYWSMLSGAAGYTYGCHDIWQMFTISRRAINGARTDWRESLHLPGSTHVMHMKKLLLSFPWQKMINDQSIVLNENRKDSMYIVCSMGKARDFIIAYTTMGRPIVPNLSKMNAERIQAFWYNPRDGYSVEIGKYNTSERHEFKPWSVGRGSDFVLVIMDTESDYSLPEIK